MTKYLHRLFFSLVILFLPVNLGLHFFSTNAFVSARLVDYLVPTIWLQDILIGLMFLFWILDFGFNRFLKDKVFRYLLLFMLSLLPSLANAINWDASVNFGLHVLLYSFLCYYTYLFAGGVANFKKIIRLLSVGIFILFLFAIFQWVKQGSVFNNYLFLGEQPYNSSTFGISRTDFFGSLKIPSYGTFRHPNVFGGFLAITLFWIYGFITVIESKLWLKIVFVLGFVSLFLTFSLTSMLSLFLGIVFLQLIQRIGKRGVMFSMIATFALFVFSLLIPYLTSYTYFQDDPSFYRRSNLLKSSFEMLDEGSLFGVGLNNFTIHLKDYLPRTQILTFNQPVHNIFVLILTESGIFSLILFVSLMFISIRGTLEHSFGIAAVLFVSVLQLVILGSFDHFLYTIHQTSILFWLTIGLALTYTKIDVEV